MGSEHVAAETRKASLNSCSSRSDCLATNPTIDARKGTKYGNSRIQRSANQQCIILKTCASHSEL